MIRKRVLYAVAAAVAMKLVSAQAAQPNLNLLTKGVSQSGLRDFTTASVTPKANHLMLLSVLSGVNPGSAAPPTLAVSGNGLTWASVDTLGWNQYTDNSGNYLNRGHLWRSMGGSPSTGTITFTVSGGSNPETVQWYVSDIVNVDTGGTNGSGAIVQSAKTCTGYSVDSCNNSAGSGSLTMTFATFGSSNNGSYSVFGKGNGSSPVLESGYINVAEQSTNAGNTIHSILAWREGNGDLTPGLSFGYNVAGVMGAEIKYALQSEVRLKSFDAERAGDDGGVLLTWKTGYEYDNIGFHLWRDDGGRWTQIDPSLIAGAALLGGPGIEVASDRTYTWLDTGAPVSAARYMLEDVDRNGKSTYHGPAVAPAQTSAAVATGGGLWGVFARPGAWWSSRQAAPMWAPSSSGGAGLGGGDADLRPARRSSMLLADINGDLTITADEATQRLGRQVDPGAPLAARMAAQRAVVMRPGVRLSVDQEGWYTVGRADLEAAGLDRGMDPRYLRLWAGGVEQAVIVRGEGDGRFDATDGVEFYGTPLDTPWTGSRTYWLSYGGAPGGRRISAGAALAEAKATGKSGGGFFSSLKRFISGGGGGGSRYKLSSNTTSFSTTLERKDRSTYIAALQTSDGTPSFFGAVVTKKPIDQILRVAAVDLSSPGEAKLEVNLQGITVTGHGVGVTINGLPVGNVEWYGDQEGAFSARVPQQFLLEGDNRVTLTAYATGNDINAVESVRLTYFRLYQAEGDALRFTAHGGKPVTVGGFSTPDVRVMDVTDPERVMRVAGDVARKQGQYSVTLTPGRAGERTLYAFAAGATKLPIQVKEHRPLHLHDTAADLIIVAHESLRDGVRPLAALHQAQGLSVATVGVQDVYDAFSFGAKDPAALKSFFAHTAFDSGHRPRAVMLVGDASFDARNNIKKGDFDFVPTRLINTGSIQTASDDWFTDFDNNGVPDVAIGRLPARTPADLSIMVGKILLQEHSKGGWNKSTLLVADARTADDSQLDFQATSNALAAAAPSGWKVDMVFKPQTGAMAAMKSELLARFNEGPGVVNYIGHGSVSVWRGNTMTGADAMALTNGSHLPFVTAMTCLNGFFHDIYSESLAESLLKAPNGGAVAVWASSALTSAEAQSPMDRELQAAIYHGDNLPLGELVIRAKASAGDGDVSRTWILFGDPLTTIF